jgi:hypothetical protein
MKLKNLLIVVAVLAVLSGAAYWMNRPAAPPPSDARIGQPIVDQAAIESAAKLRLTDQGKTVVLSRQAGGTWRDDSYYGMPVDFSKLSSFIGDLTAAKLDRLITTNPQRIARLEFTGSKIELLDAKDHATWSLDLGKNGDQGGRFVRYAGEGKAYLASLNAWLDTDPKGWADAALITLKPDDVAKIELPLEDGQKVTVSRAKKDAPWAAAPIPAGQQLKTDKVTGALSSLTALRFSDSSDPADPAVAPAKAHQRVYRLTTFDGKTYSVAMGRKPEEKKLKPIDKNAKVDLSYKPGDAGKPAGDAAAKPPTPEYDVTPAGPVYVSVTASDSAAPVNALMQKRAFQVDEYTYTSMPQKADDLFEPAPAKAAK